MAKRLPPVDAIPGEEWRPVVGWEGLYEVSNLGRVQSLPRSVEVTETKGRAYTYLRPVPGGLMALTDWTAKDGSKSLRVGLSGPDRRKVCLVSSLVAEAFLGPRGPKERAFPKDGNPLNCHADNLHWVDPQGAADVMQERGTTPRGERAGQAKLTEETVKWVRDLVRARVYTQRQIAKELKMSEAQISRIVNRTRWEHIR